MNAFEQVAAALLRHDGYWVRPSYKVNLTKEEKVKIGIPSCPRWEIDLMAYKAGVNELLIVECKAYQDSVGLTLNHFGEPKIDRLKLFNKPLIYEVVRDRLVQQLIQQRAILASPRVHLALMTAEIRSSHQQGIEELFETKGWKLFDKEWICNKLKSVTEGSYENDVAAVVAKLLKSPKGKPKPNGSI